MQEVNRKADFDTIDSKPPMLTFLLLSLFGICQSNLLCEDADKSNKEQFADE